MLRFSLAALSVLLLVANAQASIFLLLTDEVDDGDIVQRVREDADVKALAKDFDTLRRQLYPLKERDFEVLFGKPARKPAKTFAMPVAEPRALMLSGLHYANPKDNKDHTEFYAIGDFAGMEVYYHIDGVTPQVILFYLRVDKDFPKLTKDNLTKRVAWERERLRRLPRVIEERRAKVFVWEVDPDAEKKFYQGDYALDPKRKLESWLATGRKLGYRLKVEKHQAEGPSYYWYGPDGSLARHAYSNAGEQLPGNFIWYHKGNWQQFRYESYQNGHVNWRRWSRPNKSSNIRYETVDASGRPIQWTWYDGEGKVIRREWDDNGDGIPDLVATTRTGKVGRPLPLKESWAVHPELIPKDSRVPDQPDRCVLLRRITVGHEAEKKQR